MRETCIRDADEGGSGARGTRGIDDRGRRAHRRPGAFRRPARARPWRWERGVALGLLTLVLTWLTPAVERAQADACADCGPPTLAQLKEKAEDFALGVRNGRADYVEMHGGECRLVKAGPATITKVRSWLVLRGSGEVWNCPHSKSGDTVEVSVMETDIRSWALSTSLQIGGTVLGVGLAADITQTVIEELQVQTVTTITKQITANWCRRILWGGYFEVAELKATVPLKLQRRWRWWTKNPSTGHTVHLTNDYWLPCDDVTATLDAQAPLAGYWLLGQLACSEEECHIIPTVLLDFHPPLPPALPPPPLPWPWPEEDEPEGEEEGGHGDGPPAGEVPPLPGFGDTPDTSGGE